MLVQAGKVIVNGFNISAGKIVSPKTLYNLRKSLSFSMQNTFLMSRNILYSALQYNSKKWYPLEYRYTNIISNANSNTKTQF